MPDESHTPPPIPADAPSGASEFEVRLAAFVGPRWEKSYRHKMRPFLEDASFVPTWNWAAALATPFWFLYRKMYLWFAVFFFVPGAVLEWLVPATPALTPETLMNPENEQALLMITAIQISVRLAAGGMANWLLFRRASTAIRVVSMQPMPAVDSMQLLKRVGGVSRGLTLAILALFFMLALASMMSSVVPG